MTDEEHIELNRLLSRVKGKVAISGYHGDLMDELYQGWYVHEAQPKRAHSIKTERVEVLWTNYDVDLETKGHKPMLFENKGNYSFST
jgi:DNA adenine methylase